jgi:hypothetical protein
MQVRADFALSSFRNPLQQRGRRRGRRHRMVDDIRRRQPVGRSTSCNRSTSAMAVTLTLLRENGADQSNSSSVSTTMWS